MNEFELAYRILNKVFLNGAYVNIEIEKYDIKCNRALVYKIVYGVLDKNIFLDKILNTYKSSKIDLELQIILKIALYMLDNIDSIPDYAVVNNAQKMCDKFKLSSGKGFCNWLLRAYIRKEKKIQYNSDIERVSCILNVPEWAIKKLSNDYGIQDVIKMFNYSKSYTEDVRINSRIYSNEEFERYLKEKEIEFLKYKNIYKIKNTKPILKLFNEGKITYQGYSSMCAVDALEMRDGEHLLDLCSAPGGKSIYALEMANNIKVTACDIHPHRVELIKSYAKRMKENSIDLMVSDATVLNVEFLNKFDKVLVDAPCSGFGIVSKKPDILLRLKEEDIQDLHKVQVQILSNAIKYLKIGGKLVYSTCTLFKHENIEVINEVLNNNNNKDYILDNEYGTKNIFPSQEQRDGFFIARLVRIK